MTALASPPRAAARARIVVAALLCAFAPAALVAGCGSDKPTQPSARGPVLPPNTPPASAPDSTVLRWLVAYAAGVEGEADTLLAADFHFHFSSAVDPVLVDKFGGSWGKADESVSLHHLLHGFTNQHGAYLPKVSSMVFSAAPLTVVADTAHSDSTAWYASVRVAQLSLEIDVPGPDGTVTYEIRSPFEILAVRGDAAVLGPGQDHSATRWYVRECNDLSLPYYVKTGRPSTNMPLAANNASWGRIRAAYLE